jgi:hypothetical protein
MTTYRNSWHAAILQRMSQSKSPRKKNEWREGAIPVRADTTPDI